MKIPVFKPSKRFLQEFDLPCLVAKLKNSRLPGVAARHITESKDDPTCTIYLRGKGPKKISRWQRGILEQLFLKEGLAPAIEDALNEYGRDLNDYSSEQELKEIKKYGFAPFIWISVMVVDEIKKEVIFSGGSNRSVHIPEHGLSVYLRKGRWRWDDADYFIGYQQSFRRPLSKEELIEEQSKLIGTMAEEFGSIMEALNGPAKKFEKHFPASGELVKTDAKFLYGDWVFDPRETAVVLKKYGDTKDQIESQVEGRMNDVVRFAPNSMQTIRDGDIVAEDALVGCECRGKRVTILLKVVGCESVIKDEYWYDGKFLVAQAGFVFRRMA
jgi:hypothetical protein